MFEQSSSEIPSSIWASMNSWFTPAVFFVLLNLMIGTIALTSALTKKSPNPRTAAGPAAGSVLQRLKSTNFYTHFNRSQDPHASPIYKQAPDSPEAQARSFFQENCAQAPRDSSVDEPAPDSERSPRTSRARFVSAEKDSILGVFERAHEESESMDEVFSRLAGGHFGRTKSDTVPASGEIPDKLPAKMKKSASLKSAFGHFEEEKIVEARRPATVREAGAADGDVEVDAKADDFINRFKQQLRVQRLDSIVRYKDLIGRVTGAGR